MRTCIEELVPLMRAKDQFLSAYANLMSMHRCARQGAGGGKRPATWEATLAAQLMRQAGCARLPGRLLL
jgi:hypothetical protein